MTIEIDATLDLAQSMYETMQDATEVARRNIAGRLYYGVFHLARDAANISPSSANIHHELIRHFSSRSPDLSNRLNSLRKLRNRADYDLNSTVTSQELKTARIQSEYIRQALAQS